MSEKALHSVPVEIDHQYETFERLIADRVAAHTGPLFTTDASGLFDAYLAGIPGQSGYGKCNCGADRTGPSAEAHRNDCPANRIFHSGLRAHYNCRNCKKFLERYGGLVTINEEGGKFPLLWHLEGVPDLFRASVATMFRTVDRAKVTGVFIGNLIYWGYPQTVDAHGGQFKVIWTHLHGKPQTFFTSPVQTAEQAMAQKREDHGMLCRGLADCPAEAVVQAVRVLEADAVDRSEKTLGVAQWLLALHHQLEGAGKGPTRWNLIWKAVATAPEGWCHVRSTMIWTLLEDIVAGLPFDQIKRRWNEKMHPLQYQRPSAPPQEGAITQANKLVEQLQSAGALARRFARLDEVTALWRPIPTRCPASFPHPPHDYCDGNPHAQAFGGAFDHLRSKAPLVKEVELPAVKMTWEKFRDTILPTASEIQVDVPPGPAPFYGLVTAVNADAPPILQWDGLRGVDPEFAELPKERKRLDPGAPDAIMGDIPMADLPRNPVSWYFYAQGSMSSQWNIAFGWNPVAAICLKPCHWQSDRFAHQGGGIFFVIEKAKDQRDAGIGLFPETLRSEYHGIRRVIEAHSRGSVIVGKKEGNANGIALTDNVPLTVRVKSRAGTASYVLSL